LYDKSNINICTDHRLPSVSISVRNPKTKIRRWHAFIEEFSPKVHFKPGNSNNAPMPFRDNG